MMEHNCPWPSCHAATPAPERRVEETLFSSIRAYTQQKDRDNNTPIPYAICPCCQVAEINIIDIPPVDPSALEQGVLMACGHMVCRPCFIRVEPSSTLMDVLDPSVNIFQCPVCRTITNDPQNPAMEAAIIIPANPPSPQHGSLDAEAAEHLEIVKSLLRFKFRHIPVTAPEFPKEDGPATEQFDQSFSRIAFVSDIHDENGNNHDNNTASDVRLNSGDNSPQPGGDHDRSNEEAGSAGTGHDGNIVTQATTYGDLTGQAAAGVATAGPSQLQRVANDPDPDPASYYDFDVSRNHSYRIPHQEPFYSHDDDSWDEDDLSDEAANED